MYQVTPTPDSWATSSRRNPGVRRRRPGGIPTSAGVTRARLLRRKAASSCRRRCVLAGRAAFAARAVSAACAVLVACAARTVFGVLAVLALLALLAVFVVIVIVDPPFVPRRPRLHGRHPDPALPGAGSTSIAGLSAPVPDRRQARRHDDDIPNRAGYRARCEPCDQ
ncbi:hypothetical protein ABZ636_06305 [Streptomyces sp. NPDC007251]|uniref:hypothetical protein n=1 Tax=Streptomyces sp. NPDC007251 TaxID=3154483 RepID=UPI0033E81991